MFCTGTSSVYTQVVFIGDILTGNDSTLKKKMTYSVTAIKHFVANFPQALFVFSHDYCMRHYSLVPNVNNLDLHIRS